MRRRRRPPVWLVIIGALAVLVAVAWAVRESPTVATGPGTTVASTGDPGTTTAVTTETGPKITPRRRAMARLATKKLKVTNGGGRQKLVALTFDDGPGPLTKPLLSILNRLDVKATFYVQGGNVAQYPDEIRAMVAHGHEVGIHTWSHPELTKLWGDELTDQIYDTRDVIREYGGVDPGTMRPPYGAIDDRVMNALAPARLVQVLWDVDTNDWRGYSTSHIVDHVLATATAGSIVLMHDGGTQRQATLDAVEPIVNALRAKGVEFVTVEELLERDPPKEALPPPEVTTVEPDGDTVTARASDPSVDLSETSAAE